MCFRRSIKCTKFAKEIASKLRRAEMCAKVEADLDKNYHESAQKCLVINGNPTELVCQAFAY